MLSSEVRRTPRSVVGGVATWASPAKAISPMRIFGGTRPRKMRTAFCAAASLVGRTSFACIDPDTSRTRMIDARCFGTSAVACGRATAKQRTASASRARAVGTQRRRDRPATTPASTSTFGYRTAYRTRRRSASRKARIAAGTTRSVSKRSGWPKLMYRLRRRRRLRQPRGPQRGEEACGDEQARRAGEERVRDLGLAGRAAEARAELRVRGVQRARVLRLVELAAGRLGDRPQRVRVGRHRDRLLDAVELAHDDAVRRPERDGVDRDPGRLRALRALERRERAARLVPVGEEEDRCEALRRRRHRARRRERR